MAKKRRRQTASEKLERAIFKAFRATQPPLQGRRWRYEGVGGARPDIVVLQGLTGVELGEWLHGAQTQQAREHDRFEKQIQRAARKRGLKSYLKSFAPSARARFSVGLDVRAIPPARDKAAVIDELLTFLKGARKPRTAHERLNGVTVGNADLPVSLRLFFDWIRVSVPRGRVNLGIEISRGGAYDPEDAATALETLLRRKIQNPHYAPTKIAKRLNELWLVVHYDRGVLWNTPYRGIRIQAGGRATDEAAIGARARAFVQGLGAGAFDRILLFFPHQPPPIQLWP